VLAFQEVLRPEIFEYPSAVRAIVAIGVLNSCVILLIKSFRIDLF
jgi:hypothetical protein